MMWFKLILLVVSAASIWQVWYRSKLISIVSQPVLNGPNYNTFLEETQVLFLCAGLFLLVTCFFSPPKDAEKTSTASAYPWLGSFILILGICAGCVLIVNPEGRFPWNQRPSYTTLAAHTIKADLYKKLRTTPDMMLFGSSISFTTPADYFKTKWGASAFNMSFNGGGPADFIRSLNYIIQKSPDGKMPSVVLVEMLSPGLRIGNPEQTPLTMLPYLPPDQILPATGANLDSLLLNKSFSNAVFTSLFLDSGHWNFFIRFASDGTGVLASKKNRSPADYKLSVKNDLPLGMDLLACPKGQLHPLGVKYTQKLVELARTHHFSIVFYRPPINNDLYVLSKTKPDQYQDCKNLFNKFMKTLIQENPNVFYRDMSNHPKISQMGLEVYLDTHHVNLRGSRLILQALDKEIKAALAWSRLNHK